MSAANWFLLATNFGLLGGAIANALVARRKLRERNERIVELEDAAVMGTFPCSASLAVTETDGRTWKAHLVNGESFTMEPDADPTGRPLVPIICKLQVGQEIVRGSASVRRTS